MEFEHRNKEIECFIQEHGKTLLHYIYSIVKHWELAEDLYQDTIISAFLGFENFEKRASLKNWIYRIATNKCKDEWKKEKVRRRYIEETISSNKVEEYHNATEKAVFDKTLQEELFKKINELPNRYQQSLLLYYYHDYTMLDISKKTALPLSTVKTHLKRGKARLRTKVTALS